MKAIRSRNIIANYKYWRKGEAILIPVLQLSVKNVSEDLYDLCPKVSCLFLDFKVIKTMKS